MQTMNNRTNIVPTRTFDYLTILKEHYPKDDIFAACKGGEWTRYSVDEYITASRETAYGLLAKGYKAGDKIISITANRPEWNFLDMGCTLARLIYVPIYPTLSTEDFTFIFDHSDARAIFVGTTVLRRKIQAALAAQKRTIDVWLIDDSDDQPCMRQLRELGRSTWKEWESIIDNNIHDISPDDVATIIYTSGTTGRPKGVMLTHRNLTFDAHAHAMYQVFGVKHRMLSFLPLCHCYERTMNYEYQELGISIYYAEGLATIQRDLASCHADGFSAVPRVLETFYEKFRQQENNLKGLKKKIYHAAWEFGNNYDNYNRNPVYRRRLRLFDRLVYSKWRAAIGGHNMIIISGGSSIKPSIVRLFNAAKLHIFEGYGMSETSPVIAVNNPTEGVNKMGTAGKPIDGAELTFAEDGEILVRGPHVMKGYYKDPAETARIIDADGWLHTGDIGTLVEGKYLKITDRKKEIFKLSSGKYIAPQLLETKINDSPYFDSSIIVGENQKFASAIICLNYAHLDRWAESNGLGKLSKEELLVHPAVIKLLSHEIETIDKTLADYEAIKRPVYVFDEWTTANGMLSQTLKLRRAVILRHYAEQIERIYSK